MKFESLPNQYQLLFENVSRETFLKLEEYKDLLKKWQTTINLIGPTTVDAIWERHLVDSWQLVPLLESQASLVDIGSGAGLPGIVLAIAGQERVVLVEKDRRKAMFLEEVKRVLGLKVAIENKRLELVDVRAFSVITARAFASLSDMLFLLASGLTLRHKLLILKGKSYKNEIAVAKTDWTFDLTVHPSITDPLGAILELTNIQPKRSVQ